MNKQKKNLIPFDLKTLFKLFFKYPLSYFPVIKNYEIYSFISKEYILRLSSNGDFLNEDITKVFKKILYDPSLDEFFKEIDNISPKKIPFINIDNSTINFYSQKDFNAFYRPVTSLRDSDICHIIQSISTPIAIFNTSSQILFKNKSFSTNFKPLLKKGVFKKALNKEQIIEFLSYKEAKKIIINIESIKYEFILEAFSLQKTTIFLIRV